MKQKNYQNLTKNTLGKLPVWNLKDLYESPKAKNLNNDLNRLRIITKKFEKKYTSKIAKLSSSQLLKAIIELENIDIKIDKIMSYAHLLVAEDGNNEKNKIFYQQMQEQITNIASSIVFFSLELNEVSEPKLNKIYADKKLEPYKNWIKNIRKFKPYQLDVKTEKLLQEKSITSRSAWVRLFDDTIASLKFPFKGKNLSSAEIFNFLSDKKESNRKKSAEVVSAVLKDNISLFTSITNNLAKDKSINDKWRGLPNPVSSRNLSNVVEDEVVEALTETIKENYSKIAHRYYKIKAKWFKRKSLMYWDRNAPLPFQSQSVYSWKDARKIVSDAYSNFDKRAGDIVNKFFDNSWIHAPVIAGKSPGAFAASTVPSAHPFILVNYQGKARDIATLAHELGHGIHQYLAGRKQTYFNSSTPLTLAETASVFGEMLTFKSLLSITTKENERKGLLANKVEDMLNTVVRQIAFFEFEKRIHDQRKIKELSVNEICKIWIDVQKQSLGPSIKFNDDYKYFWSYIPHFIHSPFYVYAYAFGDCLVNSLFNVYESKLPKFEDKYINLLESGGSNTYDKLLKPFGLNPKKKDFWQKGVNVIESLIDQLEE
ncbi:M3 family oligoendopeptidase [Pelagibacteraceae bacterium]|nr:M3 family oligoendopeptidase [Pelagibacteraceae bacterium]